MKNPHFLHFPISSPPGNLDSGDDIISRYGGNTGNLLFIEALHRVIKHDAFAPVMGFHPRKIIERGHDGLIIPAANWLNPNSDWGGLANRIELSKLPCVMVGIGVQSEKIGNIPLITDGTKRLLKVVSERSKSISARGQFSAEVLNHYGVKNVEVTGCPSLLWKIDAPVSIKSPKPPGPSITAYASRENNIAKVSSADTRSLISRYISRLSIENGYTFVAQTEVHDITAARFKSSTERYRLEYLKKAYQELNEESLIEYLSKNLKFFTSACDWIKFLKTQDFAFGTRLHGIIAALIAGTPAMLIYHDARTQEMAQHLRIPNIPAETVLSKKMSALDIRHHFDPGEFNTRMDSYYSNFANFFAANDVATRLNYKLTEI